MPKNFRCEGCGVVIELAHLQPSLEVFTCSCRHKTKVDWSGIEQDEINHPTHYKLFPDMIAFDVIKAVLTPEELRGYLKGNILKYRLRAGQKGSAEKCIAKADWHKARLFEQEQA